jgi:hypothetical protein
VIIEEVEMDNWGFGGLPVAEFRRFAARENRLTYIISASRVLAGDGFAVDYFGRADMPSPASPQTLLALLDIEPPIVQAPMAGVSSPAMAAAVGNAGALGSIGVGAKAARSRRSGLGPRPTRPHCFVSPSFFSVSGFSVSVFALALLAACFLLCFLWAAFGFSGWADGAVWSDSAAAGGLAAGICASAGVKEAKAATMNATMSVFSIKFSSFELIERQFGALICICVSKRGDFSTLPHSWMALAYQPRCTSERAPDSLARPLLRARFAGRCRLPSGLGWAPRQKPHCYDASVSGRPARCLANRFTAFGAAIPALEIPAYPIAYDAGKALKCCR